MTINLDDKGLKSIIDNYDFYFIDLWGVIHNGIELHKKAIQVLAEITKAKKNYVLLTNAPRPNSTVKTFLEKCQNKFYLALTCVWTLLSPYVIEILIHKIKKLNT